MSDKRVELKVEMATNAGRDGGFAVSNGANEFHLSSRDVGRFTLQGAVLTVAPSAATANLAIPVTLYSRPTPPEESDTAALDEALATLSPAVRKSVTEAIAKLQEHFNHPAFDEFDFNQLDIY